VGSQPAVADLIIVPLRYDVDRHKDNLARERGGNVIMLFCWKS
jgi:hypothetical protein